MESTNTNLINQQHPLQEEAIKSLLKSTEEKVGALRRRSSVLSKEEIDNMALEDDEAENDWVNNLDEDVKKEEKFVSAIKELSSKGKELLQVAACLGSFDSRLLQASTSLLGDQLLKYLREGIEKGIINEDLNDMYDFTSDDAKKEVYGFIPSDKRERFHASIGRILVRRLAHDELDKHISTVLTQFRRGLDDITDETERNAVAVLCLRGIHCAVSVSDFRNACKYAEFGILVLPDDCWKDEYTLSLSLYNAAAEVFLCIGDYGRVNDLVDAVLRYARSYQDTLQVRATHVHSLSSSYKMREALEEALDVLGNLGEHFPSTPRLHNVVIELTRTRRLFRSKTNEMILRLPLMKNTDKVAALQILNLIFPVTYRTNPMLTGLVTSRMLQLTLRFGLNAISTVAFASFGSMLASFYKNKDDAYRCSDLAMELLERFETKEYIPRLHVFVYAEILPYKTPLRELCPYLLQAFHTGIETGDIQFAMVAAMMFEGYMFFSGERMAPIEKETRCFNEKAEELQQTTALGLLRPDLKFLQILMGKVERPSRLEMLSSDLRLVVEAGDESSACVIHFLRLTLCFIFGDFEPAAVEAKATENMLQPPYIHPGFSCMLVFHCLALLAVAPCRRALARRRLLHAVKKSMSLLESFSLCVPENCLHSLNLVQAELALVNGQLNLARGKFIIAISVATSFNDLMIQAIACERYSSFLKDQGDQAGALGRIREAHSAYKSWGAMAKVRLLEVDFPSLMMPSKS